MLVEIVKHTPVWVFVLFVVLLFLGYTQSRARVVSSGKATVLPVAMMMLSLYGVWSAFGASAMGFFAWFVGMGLVVLITRFRSLPTDILYSNESRSFTVPGSWLPLALMMAIFFTRYAVGVVLARAKYR